MVQVRISRESVEVLADETNTAGVTRLDQQAAGLSDGTDEAQVSRVAIEVLGVEPDVAGVTRLDTQALGLHDAGGGEAQVSRVAIEVLAGPDLEAAVTRLDTQAAGLSDAAGEVQVTRMAGEALARQGSAGPVSPLALVDDASIFLHNWASQAELKTSFRNALSPSPATGAESRRGLSAKPFRTQKLVWTICPQATGGATDLDELERLEVYLRRITNDRFQVPIYKDQAELDAAYLTTDDTILLDTSVRRLFPGQRVAIVQTDFCNQITSVTYHLIDTMTNASLTFVSTLGVAVAAGSYVFPMMDCEVLLEVQADYTTSRVPTISLTVAEAPGLSQLPVLKSDTPTGADLYGEVGGIERPIWFEEPDWSSGIKKGRKRQGARDRGGRADFVSLEATRSVQSHQMNLHGDRDTMWQALEFFETRRGRLRTFWHVDQDQYLEAVDLDAGGTFVGVSEIGDLADFSEEMDYIGIVMNDGTVYVRKAVTIQQVLTVFRVTMDQVIGLNLDVNNVNRVARARVTRFAKDEFTEKWDHTGHMECSVSFIEALAEDDYPTT